MSAPRLNLRPKDESPARDWPIEIRSETDEEWIGVAVGNPFAGIQRFPKDRWEERVPGSTTERRTT